LPFREATKIFKEADRADEMVLELCWSIIPAPFQISHLPQKFSSLPETAKNTITPGANRPMSSKSKTAFGFPLKPKPKKPATNRRPIAKG